MTTREIRLLAEKTAKAMAEMQDPFVNGKKAAEYLGVKTAWLSRHTEIPRVKRNGILYFRQSDLDKWIMTCE